ncbi:MAG: TRAP transporter substrate-binding protein DctP [Halofilum sp. (in: g-proteobacteria)]|nr:TRAP transporter substrate-binding protein DctP [Halofilum sp. (in: g-proteobacteria)]
MNRTLTSAAGALAGLAIAATAQAQEVTLTVHHFLSPKSPAHTELILPWAEQLREDSNGRIDVKVFPSMSLGGKPPELYRQARDGTADIVWTLIGYTPGVFPRTEVFELPNVHQGDAKATNLAIQDNFDKIAADYDEIKPLLVHVHAGNALHMRETKVTSPADVRGLKLRTPSRTGAWMIEAWGAEPVGMPVPALPQALSKGTVDGALIPFEIVPPLKIHELTEYSIVGAGGDRFGTSVFLFGMNRKRYESLPADLQRVIDENSGRGLARRMGEVWNRVEQPGRDLQRQSGGEVVELTPAQTEAFSERGAQVTERWIEQAEEGHRRRGPGRGGQGLDREALGLQPGARRPRGPPDPADVAPMHRLLHRVAAAWAIAGGALLLAIVAVTMTNVGAFALDRVARLFGAHVAGLPGYEDFVRLCVSAAVLMLLPWCQARRGHVAVDIFADTLMPARVQRSLDLLWQLLMAALALFLAWQMAHGMVETRADGALSRVLGWPLWPFYLPGIASLVLWAAVCLVDLRRREAAHG